MMIERLRPKRKAPGLAVIALIGLLQSVLPLSSAVTKPILFASIFENAEDAWIVLRLPVFFFLLWSLCFTFVKRAQRKNLGLPFFEDFNAWKGLALLLIWPSLTFWSQLLTNFHEALNFLNPFTSLVFGHLMFFVFAIVFRLLLFMPKPKKQKRSAAVNELIKNIWPNLLWGRFFHQKVSSGRLGKAVAYFTCLSYLLFFYMTILSLLTPAAMAVTTVGNTVKARNVNFVWATKYGSHTGSYCLLDVDADGRVMEFAVNTCEPCVRQPNAKVTIKHHPLDYRNRLISSAECEAN